MKEHVLKDWGLYHPSHMIENEKIGRVLEEEKGHYKIVADDGFYWGVVTEKFRKSTDSRSDFPSVGDWIVLEEAMNGDKVLIKKVLPRYSKFSRKIAGNVIDEQIIATNIDKIFIVMSLNEDFNIKRLERYLTLAWESSAIPCIILTKSDLCNDLEARIIQIEEIALGLELYVLSIFDEKSILNFKANALKKGKTVAFVGSSGVGKSTIVNYILGNEIVKTAEIRNDSKGKHTTTSRNLYLSDEGVIVIDTPGMRELQLLDNEEGLIQTFEDVEEIAKSCKFSDCTHTNEPSCAVMNAIDSGILKEERLKNYFKMKKEIEFYKKKNKKKTKKQNKMKN
ncbi:MAG: ribosome small subunit-dependent GTPase A [Clostridiales bacterium]|nr:ribosome small subunit-dependent GTPase A [Clostridiales bacterium]